MFCKNCGKEIDDKAVVCVNCGAQVNKNLQEKKWSITLILCFFLGFLGAHRFYTGHIASGLIQLVLSLSIICLFIAVFWVGIDLAYIILGRFKTSDGMNLVRKSF